MISAEAKRLGDWAIRGSDEDEASFRQWAESTAGHVVAVTIAEALMHIDGAAQPNEVCHLILSAYDYEELDKPVRPALPEIPRPQVALLERLLGHDRALCQCITMDGAVSMTHPGAKGLEYARRRLKEINRIAVAALQRQESETAAPATPRQPMPACPTCGYAQCIPGQEHVWAADGTCLMCGSKGHG